MFIRIDEAIHSDIKETSYQFEGQDDFLYFGPTDTVNIFVGANNSGKSRFLRGLIKSKDISLINRTNFKDIIQILKKNCNSIIEGLSFENNPPFSYQILHGTGASERKNFINYTHEWLVKDSQNTARTITLDINYFESLIDNISKRWFSGKGNEYQSFVIRTLKEIELAINIKNLSNSGNPKLRAAEESSTIGFLYGGFIPERKLYEFILKLKELLEFTIEYSNLPAKIYVPILRTANTLLEQTQSTNSKKITSNIFEYTTYKNYEFDKCNENVIIYHTGLDLYQKIQKTRNSKKEIRNNFSEFENFLSQNFFHNKDVDIVALDEDKEEDKHISLFIGGEERKIHELGDGIQAIILLMYPIFTAKDESWVFIEEPEINLHPSLQRIFLEQILRNEVIKKKKIKFFFTTHSNHLLDISLGLEEGVSIFTFEKRSKDEENAIFKIKNVKSQDTDILRLLGVHNSSVFMANCSIWVEGICDRLYIRAYLEAYTKQHKIKTNFKEDIHFAFFEYAGSNVAHYFFDEPEELENLPEEEKSKIKSQFLSNKIFLLADQDSGKDPKHTSLLGQENKNFQYYFLKVREIENLLSPIQLNKFLPKINKKIVAQTLSSKKIKHEDYKSEYLGEFIKNKLKGLDLGKFDAKSGTLSTYYKNKLSEEVSQDIQWDEMSDEAKVLAKAVYQFIEKSNPAY